MRREILVFAEGERTEEDYLVHWHRLHRQKVNVLIDPFRGVPRSLVEQAAAEKRSAERLARRGKGRAYDEVWCIFDVDTHPLLHEVAVMARDNDIQLAVSNPCLELWFILHFEDQSGHIERHPAQKRSRELLGCDKTLSVSALSQLEENYEEARSRAKALDDKHQGDQSPPGSNPSSGVWRIVDRIRDAD